MPPHATLCPPQKTLQDIFPAGNHQGVATSALSGRALTDPLAIDWSAALADHESWLRRVLYARLRRADEVDEVMQEVALAAVRQSSPLANAAKLAPWLYRLAVRQALMFRRRQGRRRRLEARYGATVPREGPGDPLDWLLAAERRQMVRRALQELPARDMEVLLLKHAENWSYRQIADNLGVSVSAVEARLFRARRRLRQRLTTMQPREVPT